MSERNQPNLHAPLATLIIGVTGNKDPEGYDAEVSNPCDLTPPIKKIYLRVWQFLDWVFGEETESPIGFPSIELPKLGIDISAPDLCGKKGDPKTKNKCDFFSGKLKKYSACWKPLGINHTPVVLLSSIAPGIDTIVAEVFLDYRRRNPNRSVFVRAPLPFPKEIIKQCSSYKKDEDKLRLQSLITRLREQPGWDEERDLFCVKIDRDWEPLEQNTLAINEVPNREKESSHRLIYWEGIEDVANDKDKVEVTISRRITCEAEEAIAVHLTQEVDLESTIKVRGEEKFKRNLRYRAAGEYIASFSHLLLAIYDHKFDHKDEESDEFRKPLSPFESGTWAIVEAKRRGLSWELLATSNNFSWADNGPVLRLGIRRKKRTHLGSDGVVQPIALASPETWSFLQPYDLQHKIEGLDDKQKEAIWQASGDYVFRKIIDLQENYNKEAMLTWKWEEQLEPGESELIDMILSGSETDTPEDKRRKLTDLLGSESAWTQLASLSQAASVRRCAGDLSSKVYEPKRFRVLVSLISLVFVAALCLGMFEHWHPAKSNNDEHSILLNSTDLIGALVNYLPFGNSGTNTTEAWIRAGLMALTMLTLVTSAIWYMLYNRKRIEEKRYDYRALAEALRVQIYWSVSGLSKSVSNDYMQRQKNELDWIRYVASEVSFPLERWRTFFNNLGNTQQNTLLNNIRIKWIQGQIENFKDKCSGLTHKIHLTHVFCWGLAWAGAIQFPMMFATQISSFSVEWLAENHTTLATNALLISSFGLLILLSFVLKLAIHSFRWLHPAPRFIEHLTDLVEYHFGDHEEPIAETHLSKKIIRYLVHYWQMASVALLFGALVLELSYLLPSFSINFPDQVNCWIIGTGACLVSGALTLAWQERRLYSEEYRNYSSMCVLYKAADRRLELIIKELESPTHSNSKDWVRERLIAEAQDILYQVGCEALNENAEWLILHRARPLELFMAG